MSIRTGADMRPLPGASAREAVESRRLRVLFVGMLPPPHTGMTAMTRAILDSEAARELDITLLDISDRRTLLNVGRLDLRNVMEALQSSGRFMLALLRTRPDVVYVPIAQNRLGFLRDCLFLAPALLTRRSVAVHVHGGYFDRFYAASSASIRWLVRTILRRCDVGIVLGERLRPVLGGSHAPRRLFVVPNGVADPTAGRADSARPYRRPSPDPFRVLFLSNLDPLKGALPLLEAAGLARESVEDLHLTFAGGWTTPDGEETFWRQVRDLGLEGRVEHRGIVDGAEKADLLLGSDLFALPLMNPHEGQPVAILEAMAAGLPVITTDAGAVPETVRHGENGLVLPLERFEPAVLAGALVEMARSPGRRCAMGQASRHLFLEKFTLERFAPRLVDALRAARP